MIYSAEDSGAPHRLGGCVGHTARATPPGKVRGPWRDGAAE